MAEGLLPKSRGGPVLRRPILRASSPSHNRTRCLDNDPEPPLSVMNGLASKTRHLSIGPVPQDSSPRLPILSRDAALPAERPRRRVCAAPHIVLLRLGLRNQPFQQVRSTEPVPVFRTVRSGLRGRYVPLAWLGQRTRLSSLREHRGWRGRRRPDLNTAVQPTTLSPLLDPNRRDSSAAGQVAAPPDCEMRQRSS